MKSKNKYRSKFEQRVADHLKKKKIKFEYEKRKIKYKMPESTHTYVPDFELPNGIIIEAKGLFDGTSRKKMALVKEQHPDKDIRVLLMRDQPLRKGAKSTYGQWLDKHGYIWAEKEIPAEWLTQKTPT